MLHRCVDDRSAAKDKVLLVTVTAWPQRMALRKHLTAHLVLCSAVPQARERARDS